VFTVRQGLLSGELTFRGLNQGMTNILESWHQLKNLGARVISLISIYSVLKLSLLLVADILYTCVCVCLINHKAFIHNEDILLK
jgi:hypothetical protein